MTIFSIMVNREIIIAIFSFVRLDVLSFTFSLIFMTSVIVDTKCRLRGTRCGQTFDWYCMYLSTSVIPTFFLASSSCFDFALERRRMGTGRKAVLVWINACATCDCQLSLQLRNWTPLSARVCVCLFKHLAVHRSSCTKHTPLKHPQAELRS